MWNVISAALGLTGIALALLFFAKSRSKRNLAYSLRSFTLLGKSAASLPNFEASYEKTPLTSLRATKFLLWNSGNVTVNMSDIASTDPLALVLPEGAQVLECRLLDASAPTNAVELSTPVSDKNTVVISFEYLDAQQGCVISLLHTAEEDASIRVRGTLKGGRIAGYSRPSWPFYLSMGLLVGSMVLMVLRVTDVLPMAVAYPAIFAAQILAMGLMMTRDKLVRRTQSKLDAIFDEMFDVAEVTGQQKDSGDA